MSTTELIDSTLERLQHELDSLPDPRTFRHQEEAAIKQHELKRTQIAAIRNASMTIANLKIAIELQQPWLTHLNAWRKQLCDDLLALPRSREESVRRR